jgi:hypothetical protein
MNRIDSVAGSYLPKIPSQEPLPNNTNIRHRKPQRNNTESISSNQAANMEPRRPVSEQRSRPLRQQSTTSSSENSNSRSKSRGHGSKPSSRRTSCTIVDPSRPARHYRMKSFQTPPTTTIGQDVDDVLALHFRSCSIFTNPSYHSNSGLPSPTLSQGDVFGFPSAATRFSSDSLRVVEETCMPRQSEDTIEEEKANTTMHWTSPCTRKREYERIDKANSSLRGFFRKVTPRCVSGPQEKFYEKDQSDAGSVRRYRMDDLDDAHMNEKDTARPRTSPAPRPNARPGVVKRWTCF